MQKLNSILILGPKAAKYYGYRYQVIIDYDIRRFKTKPELMLWLTVCGYKLKYFRSSESCIIATAGGYIFSRKTMMEILV